MSLHDPAAMGRVDIGIQLLGLSRPAHVFSGRASQSTSDLRATFWHPQLGRIALADRIIRPLEPTELTSLTARQRQARGEAICQPGGEAPNHHRYASPIFWPPFVALSA
jgi:hypothetical protein